MLAVEEAPTEALANEGGKFLNLLADEVWYATAMKLALETGALLLDDVPGEVELDDAQLLYVTSLFQSVVDDVVAATAGKDGALKLSSADRARFKKWMEFRYAVRTSCWKHHPRR